MHLFKLQVAALWCSVAVSAIPNPHSSTNPLGSGLGVKLGRAPSDESVGEFLKRSLSDAEAAGISPRDSNPGLHALLTRADPEETVGTLIKRDCAHVDRDDCCPVGQIRCCIPTAIHLNCGCFECGELEPIDENLGCGDLMVPSCGW